jgi:eukaryotic-like serine/threonine-protein kinase
VDALAQLTNALSGRYTVDREIGAGGMATVYLARDVKHGRQVALKVLNPELGAVLGVERFLSEIRVTAALQHPNLLPLFDSGEAEGLLFYVMPFVEGETLRRRLEREKQLPVDEAVRIAVAVANALDYAHGHGVIHRDLKPENVLLQHGQPVVADFGIALAVSNAGGGRITQTGLSLGTPQYMSPEQATGDRVIDGRTDIYSLAAVLYEMLAGEAPHAGGTAQAIIAKLMTEEVRPLTVLRRTVPPHVDTAVRRALQKLPADRFASASQFADALTSPGAVTSPQGATASAAATAATSVDRRSRVLQAVPWAIAAAALSLAAFVFATRERPSPRVPVHFTIDMPPSVTFDPIRASILATLDGSTLIYTAARSGITQIFVRSLSEEQPRELPGTETASALFMSPDGTWIGFRAVDGLKKVPVGGGPVTVISRTPGVVGATWGPNDQIVYSIGTGPLMVVSANGGEPKPLTKLSGSRNESVHTLPSFIAGENALVFTISGGQVSSRELAVATLDGEVTPLGVRGTSAMFVRPSSLVYAAQDGSINVVPFDPKSRRVTGPSTTIVQGVYMRPSGHALFTASQDGSLAAFVQGVSESRLGLLGGGSQVQVLTQETRRYRHPRVSPDGSRIALDVTGSDGAQDVWVFDVKSGALTRLTFDGRSADPLWSPDGLRIAFSRMEAAALATDTYEVAADGSGTPKLLVGGPGSQWPGAWMPDGKTLIFDEIHPGPLMHIGTLGPDGKRTTIVEQPNASTRLPAISPDGRWIAYASNESGRVEVYVRAMQGSGRWQASIAGGTQPVWSRDGKTLYYRTDSHIVAASVSATNAFTITERRDVFDDRFAKENTINFDIMPDNKRFAVVIPVDQGMQIRLVVNWMDEVRGRVGR